ncbi:hypothetical protein GHK86_07890 [Acidimicrobiaceae bacterium USS-CC1]|uniref:Glyoxalase n=1 Tax=Acidiferrimicrobium australe TaxID=2664430 RepID=A0ABW9QS32_9ACTN|nr:hypothetical protein [Acidiferrimicrobium australe]
MLVRRIDHVQLAMPAGGEDRARAFYTGLRAAGVAVGEDEPLPGYRRVYVDDPFGNRIELLEPASAG